MWNSIFLLGGGKFDYVCSLFANSYSRTRDEMSRKSNFGTEKQKPIRTHPSLATRGNTNQSQTCSRRIVVSDTSFFFAFSTFYYFFTTIHCAQKGYYLSIMVSEVVLDLIAIFTIRPKPDIRLLK